MLLKVFVIICLFFASVFFLCVIEVADEIKSHKRAGYNFKCIRSPYNEDNNKRCNDECQD